MAVGTRFSDTAKANSFDAQGGGINSTGATAIAYAASINLPVAPKQGLLHFYDFATLTGNLTLNAPAASIANFQEGDEIILRFVSDANARIVTFGTNFRTQGAGTTFTVGAAATVWSGVAICRFMDGKICVVSTMAGV